jgi:hypothetical protein
MTNQSTARLAGNYLRNFPQLHAFAKRAYLAANWAIRPQRSFVHKIATGYRLQSPAEWAGVAEHQGQTFFGYYDKSPWSTDGRRFLVHASEAKSKPERISIVLYDASTHERRTIASSAAWNLQQGAMLQWLQWGDFEAIAFNDFLDGRLICRIISTTGAELHRMTRPVQSVSPDGRIFASINYDRLTSFRPEYGYQRLSNESLPPSENDGLFLLNTDSGVYELRISISELMSTAPRSAFHHATHWINHVAFSPQGDRLVFLHRWGNRRHQSSRLYVLHIPTNTITLVLDGGLISHYCWLDNTRLFCYCESDSGYRYHYIDATTASALPHPAPEISNLSDGHPSFSAANGMVVTDTYPDKFGVQRLACIEPTTGAINQVASVVHPPVFHGVNRCDLHPRWHPLGTAISFDSVMTGTRRCWILQKAINDQ